MSNLERPEWLTEDFIVRSLRPQLGSNVKVTKSIKPASVESNGSEIFEAEVGYGENSQLPLLIKTPLRTCGSIKIPEKHSSEVCTIERNYYSTFIKRSKEIFQHNIVPNYYNSEGHGVILEDLRKKGYKVGDHHKLLDFEQCKLYIKNSAMLHALSVVSFEKDNKIFENLRESNDLKKQNNNNLKTMLLGSFRCMADFVKDKPAFKKFHDVLKESYDQNEYIWQIYDELNKIEHSFKALVQNDPCCANMLFSTGAGTSDMKLIDFQRLEFTSPLKELLTFMWISTNEEVRETKLNELYTLYCNLLNENLKKFGSQQSIKIDDFKSVTLNWSPHLLFSVCMLVPMCLSDAKGRIEEYINGEVLKYKHARDSQIYKTQFQGAAFESIIPKLLAQLEKHGVFDDVKKRLDQAKSK